MDGLCAAYQHPVTGENSCARIQSDKRCQLDDAMSLHAGIATALAFTGYNADPTATEHARRKLCECSCFSDIVDVYTPIFEMWKHYDPEVEVKMSLLQTSTVAGLCTEDVTASLNAKVEESNGARSRKRAQQRHALSPLRLLLPKGHKGAALVQVLPGLANPEEHLIDGNVMVRQVGN